MAKRNKMSPVAKILFYSRLIPSSLYWLSAVAVITILFVDLLSLNPLWMAAIVVIHGILSLLLAKQQDIAKE